MIDREKLIKGLRCHLRIDGLQCKDCPYWKNIRNTCICEKEIEIDALTLLNEQEDERKRNPVIVCPHCGKRVK